LFVRYPTLQLGEFHREDIMGTVLFTDNGILVFAMTTGAIALMLMLAVLGLTTTHQTRSDIEHQWLPRG
jgi:hypothetical protein